MQRDGERYLSSFRHGEDFRPPSSGFIADDRPDTHAIAELGEAMAIETAAVREQLVALLVDIGLQLDPLREAGTEALRVPQIIELLAGPALTTSDLGSEAAMDALRKLVPARDLARHAAAFVAALVRAPSDEGFLLVAKVKPAQLRAEVDALATAPDWLSSESAQIARAALGARDVEDSFLATADRATTGPALARALASLGLIGTPRSLRAIALQLRTPLTITIPGAFERSVRLNALEALLYNFPEEPALYPNNIVTEDDYAAAERFCRATLGVTLRDPPPPFMTVRGFPIPG